MKKILVREAKASGASKVIVGTSKAHHTISSSTCLAKYCARKLSKSFSVFGVRNGKIMFQREATLANVNPLQGLQCLLLSVFLYICCDPRIMVL